MQGFVTGATQAQISFTYRPEMEECVFEMGLMQLLCMATSAHAEGWSP